MGIPIIGDLIDAAKDLVSEVVVDKDKRNQINLELAKLGDEAEARLHTEVLAQIDVNKTEAQSGSVFVAGWRPFVGWVGGFSLAYSAILFPLLSFVSRVCGYKGSLPEMNDTLLVTIMTGMLGIGAQRSYEKVKGVSTNDYTDTPAAALAIDKTPIAKPKKKFKIF